jgi:hypothetical protein
VRTPQDHPSAADALLDALVFYREPERVDRAGLSTDVRAGLDAFASRMKRFKSRLPPLKGRSGEMRMVHSAQVGYERRLAATSPDPAAGALAAAFVQKLRPCYEWEGFADCPEREAVFADDYLAAHPNGPFTPYLTLLSAHRWLCTAEGYDYEKKPQQGARARQEYERRITDASRVADPMMRTAAEALRRRGRCHSASA